MIIKKQKLKYHKMQEVMKISMIIYLMYLYLILYLMKNLELYGRCYQIMLESELHNFYIHAQQMDLILTIFIEHVNLFAMIINLHF